MKAKINILVMLKATPSLVRKRLFGVGSIILSIMLCSGSCDFFLDVFYFFDVHNNSSDTVWCYSSYNYPDTSLSLDKPRLRGIKPGGYTKIINDEKFEDALPRDTLIVFILSQDTVDAYDWAQIRDDYKIIKRYDLSISELDEMSWTIKYP